MGTLKKRNTTKERRAPVRIDNSPAEGHPCNFVKTAEQFLISSVNGTESCVLHAFNRKRRCPRLPLQKSLLDRRHQRRRVLSCLPMLFYAVKTANLYYAPKKVGSCGAAHPTTRQGWKRYSPEPNEYMKFACVDKRTNLL